MVVYVIVEVAGPSGTTIAKLQMVDLAGSEKMDKDAKAAARADVRVSCLGCAWPVAHAHSSHSQCASFLVACRLLVVVPLAARSMLNLLVASDHLQETCKINSGLTALNKVINELNMGMKPTHREHVLTRALQARACNSHLCC